MTYMLNYSMAKPANSKKPTQLEDNNTTEVIKGSEEAVNRWVSEGLKPDEVIQAEKEREKDQSKRKEK